MFRIILEGPDCGGKSTLAADIVGPYDRRHLSRPKTTPIREVYDVLGARHAGTPVIHDRLHLSEDVYGSVFPAPGRGIDGVTKRLLERRLLSEPTVVVLCLPPYKVAYSSWLERTSEGKEMYSTKYREIYAGYSALSTSLPVVHYDYTTDTPPDLWRQVSRLLDQRRPDSRAKEGEGSMKVGNTLVVLPPRMCEDPDPWHNDDSEAIRAAYVMDQAGVGEDGFFWVHAVDHNGDRQDPGFLNTLAPSRVVSLGAIASDWCDRANQYHVNLPTFAEWKREGNTTDNHPFRRLIS